MLSLALGLFLGPVAEGGEGVYMTGVFFLTAGVLSLLLALLYFIDAWQYSSAVEEERAARPVGRLDVEGVQQQGGGGGGGGGSYYAEATLVAGPPSFPSAPPMPQMKQGGGSTMKMQAMAIE